MKGLFCSWPLAFLFACFGGKIPLIYIFDNYPTCQEKYHSVYVLIASIISEIFYFCVVITSFFVLYLIYKYEYRQKIDRVANNVQINSSKSFLRLLIIFLTYLPGDLISIFHPPMNLFYLTGACEAFSENKCYVDNERGLIKYERPQIIYLSLMLFFYDRLLLDPIVNVIMDRKLRLVIKKRFGWAQSNATFLVNEAKNSAE